MAKKLNEVIRITEERNAISSLNHRRMKMYRKMTQRNAQRAFGNLKAHSFVPKSLNEAAVVQYKRGGFSKYLT
jgi:low affinity Fe/Cu permease